VQDITGATIVQVIVQYIRVWGLLLDFTLTEAVDRFIWKWTASDEFSSASAYIALFFGRSSLLGASHLWKTQAPGRVRFFGWLVLHGRCWTSDRLRRHGLSDIDVCALSAQEVETLDHLLLGCVHSRETWFCVLRFFGMADLAPSREEPVAVWWLCMRKAIAKPSRKGFDTLVWLVALEREEPTRPRVGSLATDGPRGGHHGGRAPVGESGLRVHRRPFGFSSLGCGALISVVFRFLGLGL
jgi:hypothetical protein